MKNIPNTVAEAASSADDVPRMPRHLNSNPPSSTTSPHVPHRAPWANSRYQRDASPARPLHVDGRRKRGVDVAAGMGAKQPRLDRSGLRRGQGRLLAGKHLRPVGLGRKEPLGHRSGHARRIGKRRIVGSRLGRRRRDLGRMGTLG